MGVTRQIPRAEWQAYFDRFTRRQLASDEGVTVEVVSPATGDRREAQEVRLTAVEYDPRSQALEVALQGLDHLVYHPTEIWVIEDDGDVLATIELGRRDGTKELIHVHRSRPVASGEDHRRDR
jgi:hypothetical protein